MRLLRTLLVAGAAGGAYAFAEAHRYRLVEHVVPVPAHVPETTILHLSDTHLLAHHRRLIAFLEELPDRLGAVPDFVIATGDLIEDDAGIAPLVEAFGRIEARLGRYYVLGSHDLYRSSLKGAFGSWRMLVGLERSKATTVRNDHDALERGLQDKGWKSLVNSTDLVDAPGGRIRLCGTHDAYLNLHTTDHAHRDPDDALAIAAVHSPDIVSEWLLAGFDLVLAGHTHAGQVRLPGLGSIVTNSSLPNELSGGLHRVGNGWLHTSPGLGTGRYARIRLLAPPEATLLRISPH